MTSGKLKKNVKRAASVSRQQIQMGRFNVLYDKEWIDPWGVKIKHGDIGRRGGTSQRKRDKKDKQGTRDTGQNNGKQHFISIPTNYTEA